MKKALALVLCLTFLLFAGCSGGADNVSNAAETGFSSIVPQDEVQGGKSDKSKDAGYQLEAPQPGEEIAVVETSLGTVRVRLFPHAAPKAVYNFKALAETGYYDGLTFHRVMQGFMVQGGDPQGNGTGGESIWGSAFADEFNGNLLNLRGSLAMANSGPDTNGSQFFINQAPAEMFAGWASWEENFALYQQNKDYFDANGASVIDMDRLTEKVRALYEENGGNPWLDGAYSTSGRGHTVFGQVFEGMDVVDAIAAVEVNSDSKPLEEVLIKSIRIVKYEAEG